VRRFFGLLCAVLALSDLALAGTGDRIQNESTLNAGDLETLLRSSIHSADVRRSLLRRTAVRAEEQTTIRRRSMHPVDVANRIRTAAKFSARVMASLERMTEFTDAERARVNAEFRPDKSVRHLGPNSWNRGPTEFTRGELSRIRESSMKGDYTRTLLGLGKNSAPLRLLLQSRSIATPDRLGTYRARSAD
jgi:hypothetical protein